MNGLLRLIAIGIIHSVVRSAVLLLARSLAGVYMSLKDKVFHLDVANSASDLFIKISFFDYLFRYLITCFCCSFLFCAEVFDLVWWATLWAAVSHGSDALSSLANPLSDAALAGRASSTSR